METIRCKSSVNPLQPFKHACFPCPFSHPHRPSVLASGTPLRTEYTHHHHHHHHVALRPATLNPHLCTGTSTTTRTCFRARRGRSVSSLKPPSGFGGCCWRASGRCLTTGATSSASTTQTAPSHVTLGSSCSTSSSRSIACGHACPQLDFC
eukprot:356907-Chlamydomonas_euryale.AAC.1